MEGSTPAFWDQAPVRLAAFAFVLVSSFGIGLALGNWIGPDAGPSATPAVPAASVATTGTAGG